jgi:molecular chaperone GrpE
MIDKIKPKKKKVETKSKDIEKALASQIEKISALEAQILYGQAETENNRKRALEEAENYKDGVELTAKQLSTIFEKFNIEEFNPIGETFNPNFHQAMTMLDSDDEPNKILSVFQKGYALNGRVLRPALVSVSKEKEKKA